MPKKTIYAQDKADKFLSKHIKIAKSQLTKNLNQALKAATKLKYPLVLKIISLKALHKTDIGGIKTCNNEQELENNYKELEKLAKKKRLRPYQILAQEFIKGKELIIGIKKDPTFQHVIMLGLGGIFVEILKDVTFRACPITNKDAQEMINELNGGKVLCGVRGGSSININKLKQTLVKVSQIPTKNKKILELDINPLIANEKDVVAVDTRIVFD